MSATTPEQTQEFDIPNWYGQHLERATVLSTVHIATLSAALAGIHAVVNVLHDREVRREESGATHAPSDNRGLLAAIHSLTTLVQVHTTEDVEELPDFILDTEGVNEVRSVAYGYWMRRTIKLGQQAQAATKTVAPKPAKRATSTSAQPIQ